MASQPGAEVAAAPPADEAAAVKGIQDIQAIEEKVIGCIEIAAEVVEQLSRIGEADKARVIQLCSDFMANVQAAQALVQEGIKKSVNNKAFEASSYHARIRAQIAMEKLAMVAGQVEAMQKALQAGNEGGVRASFSGLLGRPPEAGTRGQASDAMDTRS